jgi:hypothetical protein
MKCSCCERKIIFLYVGEDWNSEDYFIIKSFWLGKDYPLCLSCAIKRTKESHLSFENMRAFSKALSETFKRIAEGVNP